MIQLMQKMDKGESIRKSLTEHWNNSQITLLLDKFKVIKFIGKGAFGQIYQAQDTLNGRIVALKLIDYDQVYRKFKSQSLRTKVQRYLLTQETLMRKCHSAYILKIYDVIENKKCKVFALQYCNNGNLEQYIKRRGGLQQNDAVAILKQIIFGLAEMHRNYIVHRDLKPANILIHNGVFKIADFGFSKQLQSEDELQIGTHLGSPNTMAPEVANSQPYGLKADIWSLGMVFFLMTYCNKQMSYIDRHKEARLFAAKEKRFIYDTISKQKISEEASDFLCKTIVIDQFKRMNWLMILQHNLFSKKSKKLPIIYAALGKENFKNLRQEVLEKGVELDKPPHQSFASINSQNLHVLRNEKAREFVDENFNLLNREYLQCRKSQFFLNKLIIPLQEKHLLDMQNREHIQLIYLLSLRCRGNISYALQNIKKVYPETSNAFKEFHQYVTDIYAKTNKKFAAYDQILYKCENQVGQMFKDFVKKIVKKSQSNLKERFLNGVQNSDFARKDQLNFIYQKYIVNIINEIKGNERDQKQVKSIFKAYRAINSLTIEELAGKQFQEFIQETIREQE